MEQEFDAGVPYLNALKQSASPFAETASVASPPADPAGPPPTMAVADSTGRLPGSEKRQSLRYKCQGSTELSEDGMQVRTWATLSDISLHGCYVEAQATYPVGTVLHLKLEANGVRVETKGSVRVSYPYLGMGIAFVEMSDDNRARLRELLATITRPPMALEPAIPPPLSAGAPAPALTPVPDPAAVVQALLEFFAERQVLMREGFHQILRKCQQAKR